jgi:hypothetical protein
MYLSDRDLEFAVKTGQLIVDPAPTEFDTTSIDLHLDNVHEAKIWNVEEFKRKQAEAGNDSWLRVSKYKYRIFSREYYQNVPEDPSPSNEGIQERRLNYSSTRGLFTMANSRICRDSRD